MENNKKTIKKYARGITLLCCEDVKELDIPDAFEAALISIDPSLYNKLVIACQEYKGFNTAIDLVRSGLMFVVGEPHYIVDHKTPEHLLATFLTPMFNWDKAERLPEVKINFGTVETELLRRRGSSGSLYTYISNVSTQQVSIANYLKNSELYPRTELIKYYSPTQICEAYKGYKSLDECTELWNKILKEYEQSTNS
jgi:hypothetical protein